MLYMFLYAIRAHEWRFVYILLTYKTMEMHLVLVLGEIYGSCRTIIGGKKKHTTSEWELLRNICCYEWCGWSQENESIKEFDCWVVRWWWREKRRGSKKKYKGFFQWKRTNATLLSSCLAFPSLNSPVIIVELFKCFYIHRPTTDWVKLHNIMKFHKMAGFDNNVVVESIRDSRSGGERKSEWESDCVREMKRRKNVCKRSLVWNGRDAKC